MDPTDRVITNNYCIIVRFHVRLKTKLRRHFGFINFNKSFLFSINWLWNLAYIESLHEPRCIWVLARYFLFFQKFCFLGNCFKCGEAGHFARECTNEDTSGGTGGKYLGLVWHRPLESHRFFYPLNFGAVSYGVTLSGRLSTGSGPGSASIWTPLENLKNSFSKIFQKSEII